MEMDSRAAHADPHLLAWFAWCDLSICPVWQLWQRDDDSLQSLSSTDLICSRISCQVAMELLGLTWVVPRDWHRVVDFLMPVAGMQQNASLFAFGRPTGSRLARFVGPGVLLLFLSSCSCRLSRFSFLAGSVK